ncbi:MAG: DUF167 domain-containing protein [Thermoplasmatota archaeon]
MDYTDAISVSNNEVLLKVYVISNASNSLFPANYNIWRNCIEIYVKASAKENKANQEVIRIISKYLNVLSSDVTIKSGKKSKEKIIAIKNIQHHGICKKIKESLHGLSSNS